jgi:hypothetical protein
MNAAISKLTDKEQYWTDDFEVNDDDLDYLFNLFLETEAPLSLRDLTLRLIEYRLNEANRYIDQQIRRGALFQPQQAYDIGQQIVFPSRQYEMGEVVAKRTGNNAEHGDFEVIQVRFDGDRVIEFASNLLTPHQLNVTDADDLKGDIEEDATHVLRRYGRYIARKLRDRFDENPDVVYLAGRWFLQSLLTEVNIGHLNLAEAVLDMHGGGPVGTEQILSEIGMDLDDNQRLHVFSMDYAMQQDKRFDEVGPAGKVLWFLHRMEPDMVRKLPPQLEYEPTQHNTNMLTPEMRELVFDIDDELSPIELPESEETEVTITLTYPYRRTGTLPLAATLQHLFPTAFETTQIITTLVDAETGDEAQGWVVRELGYVYGLDTFYRNYGIPVGAFVTVRRHEDPTKLIIEFATRNPRTELIRMAVPTDNTLRFETHKRKIPADYDDLMIFGVEDLAALDQVWKKNRSTPISTLVKRLMPELAALTPQATVHLKTLYSAVNLIKRCPPEPILVALTSHPEFEYVGSAYWKMAEA